MKNRDKLFLPLNIPDCLWAVITFSRFNNRGKWIDTGKYILLLLVVMCTHVKVSRGYKQKLNIVESKCRILCASSLAGNTFSCKNNPKKMSKEDQKLTNSQPSLYFSFPWGLHKARVWNIFFRARNHWKFKFYVACPKKCTCLLKLAVNRKVNRDDAFHNFTLLIYLGSAIFLIFTLLFFVS